MGRGNFSTAPELFRSSFFGNAFFGFSFISGFFSSCFDFHFNGFGFTIAFGFDCFNSSFSFHDFRFGGRLASERGTSENKSGSSASKQFRHWEYSSS